jgi:hypothetical protein
MRGEGHVMDGVGVLPLPATELGDLPLTKGRENNAGTASAGKFSWRLAANVGVLCNSTGNAAGERACTAVRTSAAGDEPDVTTGGDARTSRWAWGLVGGDVVSVSKGSNLVSSKCRRISEGNPKADNDGDLCMRGAWVVLTWAMFNMLPGPDSLGCRHREPSAASARTTAVNFFFFFESLQDFGLR